MGRFRSRSRLLPRLLQSTTQLQSGRNTLVSGKTYGYPVQNASKAEQEGAVGQHLLDEDPEVYATVQ